MTTPFFLRAVAREQRNGQMISDLVSLWERSVRATHDFLSEADIAAIKREVPGVLRDVEHVVIACGYEEDAGGKHGAASEFDVAAERALGFACVQGDALEALFIEPGLRGRGIGRALVSRTVSLGATRVDVNEQNPQAVGFYEHLGFKAVGRSETDEQGRPFPLLHLKLADADADAQAQALAREVLSLHEQKHNCAQSTACAFAPLTPFSEETFFALMEGFGAGMGGELETCGVVSGGVAVIGALSSDGRENRTTKKQTYEAAADYVARFRAKHGSTCCGQLKAASPTPTPHRCDAYMQSGASLLLQTLEDHGLVK